MPTVFTSLNPATYSPVAAEIWYGTNSASSGTLDFKYIYTITGVNPISGATTSLGTYKEPPRPDSGQGLFSPHRILRSSISYNLNPFGTQSLAASQSITGYTITRGFSYDPNIAFIDIVPYIGANAWIAIQTFTPNDIVAGDRITIELDNPNVNPQYAGISTVVSVTNIFGWQYIEINKIYVPGSLPESGYIVQQERINGGTTPTFWAWNGTRQYTEGNKNFYTEFVISESSGIPAKKQYLTNYKKVDASATYTPNTAIPVFNENYYTIGYLCDPTSFGANWFVLYDFYDAAGNFVLQSSLQFYESFNINRKVNIPAGPRNLIEGGLWPGTGPYAGATPSYYAVRIIRDDTPLPPITPLFRDVARKWFKIEENCSPYGKNYRIAFLNRLGEFDYFNFNWKWINTLESTQELWRQTLPFNYTVGTRGDAVLARKATETWQISSYWITQSDYEFLKELITTGEAYLIDELTKQILPIIIETSSWKVKTTIDDKLFGATIQFRMAFDINLYNN